MKKVSTYKTHIIYQDDSLGYPTFHIASKKAGFWADFVPSVKEAKKLINKVYPRI